MSGSVRARERGSLAADTRRVERATAKELYDELARMRLGAVAVLDALFALHVHRRHRLPPLAFFAALVLRVIGAFFVVFGAFVVVVDFFQRSGVFGVEAALAPSSGIPNARRTCRLKSRRQSVSVALE